MDPDIQMPRETDEALYDQEIAALSNIVSSLKVAKNTQAPISTLPDDVLLEIFTVAESRSVALASISDARSGTVHEDSRWP